MKKSFAFSSVLLLCTFFLAYAKISGGDVLEIFINGRQVHQQFVHVDKSVKPIQLASQYENDRIEVFYSHCGYAGKSRSLQFKNENGDVLKEIKYPEAGNKQRFMKFYRKDISKKNSGIVKLYYSSEEMPVGKWIATIVWSNTNATVRTASL